MTYSRKQQMRRPPRFRRDSRHYHILENISTGDLFWGFLTSATSTRLMYKNAYMRAKERYANKLALERLEQNGYVRRKMREGKPVFFATKEGKHALERVCRHTSRSTRHPEHWDGVWRMVAYDFPEKMRSRRNALREILQKSGFLQIQKSVWVFPYKAPLLIDLFATDRTISTCTLVMEVTKISLDTEYKRHFQLK